MHYRNSSKSQDSTKWLRRSGRCRRGLRLPGRGDAGRTWLPRRWCWGRRAASTLTADTLTALLRVRHGTGEAFRRGRNRGAAHMFRFQSSRRTLRFGEGRTGKWYEMGSKAEFCRRHHRSTKEPRIGHFGECKELQWNLSVVSSTCFHHFRGQFTSLLKLRQQTDLIRFW